MTYFKGDERQFQIRKDFKFRAPAYVISYWRTGIDTSFLCNQSFRSYDRMLKRVTEIKGAYGPGIYSSLRTRFISKRTKARFMPKPKPKLKTITFSELKRLSFCNSKKLPKHRVVLPDGRLMEWVGIGWISVDGSPTDKDVRVVE